MSHSFDFVGIDIDWCFPRFILPVNTCLISFGLSPMSREIEIDRMHLAMRGFFSLLRENLLTMGLSDKFHVAWTFV